MTPIATSPATTARREHLLTPITVECWNWKILFKAEAYSFAWRVKFRTLSSARDTQSSTAHCSLSISFHVRHSKIRFYPRHHRRRSYLHLGHAKSICLNFGIAQEISGAKCHLRFDDTNPEKEETEYVESIKEDVKWLGFDWGSDLYFASDYFEFFYDCAVHLIKSGLAYVDEESPEEIKLHRGNVQTPGTPSKYRGRSVEENLEIFAAMRAGKFKEGEAVLRAKIGLTSSNMNMRDPVLYRIMHAHHHNTGDAWCIYPMYDFAHPLEDALEHITHSLCTLEFENHRPLYDWFIENCPVPTRS
jgi:glutaminyl-tRNA synthetase